MLYKLRQFYVAKSIQGFLYSEYLKEKQLVVVGFNNLHLQIAANYNGCTEIY